MERLDEQSVSLVMTRPDSIMHVPQLFFGVSAMGRLLLDQVITSFPVALF
jgi:hypothetical protein